MKYILIILCLAVSFTSYGEDILKQKIEMRIDSIGDARVVVSMNMNANQWQVWNQTYGNNPAMLKRAMERQLPGYFMDDYNLEKDDMNRSFTFSFTAYGVCKVDKKGRWILETEDENPDITELSENKYMLVTTENSGGVPIQQTQIITFPDGAEGIEIDKDSFNKTQFEFKMAEVGGGVASTFWIGLALAAAGMVWGGVVFRKK
ncbi:hypothetical protein AB9P05_17790 [Roseivirga sp. BDSF3-8]|uniref:hypothetical protein n=1 Tax=Roseivirga sp. BDSF3-8 TaxID=3241598 RepID=UPI0035320DD8